MWFPRMVSPGELPKLVEEYNLRAKKFNITSLAVSALIKKLAIIYFPMDDLAEPEIVNFTKNQLELRFQRLFTDLLEASKSVTDLDFQMRLEVDLFRIRSEIDQADEVDEDRVVLYESSLEVSQQVKRIGKVDISEVVNWCRTKCVGNMSKVADLNAFLEAQLETKFHLPIIAL